MKKFICILFMLFTFSVSGGYAEQPTLLTGSVSMVPKSFYGTWRVSSQRLEQNSDIFKEKSLDVWNMFNGAKAEINVENSNERHVIFTKNGEYGKKKLSDKADIYIDGDYFEGFDYIRIDTYVGGKIVKTQSAKFKIKGEKIGGSAVTD